jgi:hypothetical protein
MIVGSELKKSKQFDGIKEPHVASQHQFGIQLTTETPYTVGVDVITNLSFTPHFMNANVFRKGTTGASPRYSSTG